MPVVDQNKDSSLDSNYLAAVKQAMGKAYAPYSNYPVGALVVTEDGQTFAGCNVENASYPEGHCAETAAIAAMVLAGHQRIKQNLLAASANRNHIRRTGNIVFTRKFPADRLF